MTEADMHEALDIRAMEQVATGEIEAFAGVVERNQDILLNFFRRMGADTYGAHSAEDLVQETFVRLFKWRERYRPTAKFRTFLFTLARHAWVDLQRKRARTLHAVGLDAVAEPTGGREHAGTVQRRMDVLQALRSLSEKQRAVVVLSTYHGLNYREIGEVLEIPEGTVKSRMFQAMRALREILGDLREE